MSEFTKSDKLYEKYTNSFKMNARVAINIALTNFNWSFSFN